MRIRYNDTEGRYVVMLSVTIKLIMLSVIEQNVVWLKVVTWPQVKLLLETIIAFSRIQCYETFFLRHK
jgi:hypothetical protein